jgi:predicted nucleotidyltransferase
VFNNSDTPTRLDISENWLFGSYLFNNSHAPTRLDITENWLFGFYVFNNSHAPSQYDILLDINLRRHIKIMKQLFFFKK